MTLPVVFTAGTGAYNIQRSLRFRSSASAYLSRSPASASNQTTWTWSGWVKLGALATGTNQCFFGAGNGGSTTYLQAFFDGTSQALTLTALNSSSVVMQKITSSVYRDPSAWYHIVLAYDSTQATSTNRIKIYVNGSQITSFSTNTDPAQNTTTLVNSTSQHTLSSLNFSSRLNYFDGYLTEINFIDGQALTPSSFGQTNPATGVWQPIKYSGTYGTNGFYLNFSDNSSNTATTIGKDYSGNGNNWTPNNISVTSGATYDSMTDVPTQAEISGNGNSNYCVLNPLKNNATLSNANLNTINAGSAGYYTTYSTMAMTAGKYYWEVVTVDDGVNARYSGFGIADPSMALTSIGSNIANTPATNSRGWLQTARSSISVYTTGLLNNGAYVNTTLRATTSGTRIFMVAYDADTGKCWMGYEGSWWTGSPSGGTGEYFTATAPMTPVFTPYNDGSNASLFGDVNFGQRPFAYTPPTGFKALNTFNLPTPTIGATSSTLANKYFDATLYTGTGSSQSITGLNFQPDWTWIKGRSGATDHGLYDAVRGVQKQLESNNTDAETTETTGLTAFNSNGFTVGALAQLNTSSATYVGWNWKANGSGSSNTDGSITSTVSANTTAGFSVVTYTGTSAAGTIGHGLNVAPSMIIVKPRSATVTTDAWNVYHASLGNTQFLVLNATDAAATASNRWNNTSPTSSVFSIGTVPSSNGVGYVAYCFSEVAGYSRFGSYTGNGSADGPFVFCGFRPKYVLTKSSSGAENWYINDSARDTYNPDLKILAPNTSDAEVNTGSTWMDLLSNGFKIRYNTSPFNTNGATYIYMAFAENPLKYSLAR